MPYHPHQRKQLACLRQQVKSLLGLSVYGNSNTDLEEALEVNSVPSSVWSHKLKRTFRKIQTSKRHVLKKLNISKTHFIGSPSMVAWAMWCTRAGGMILALVAMLGILI